MESSEEYALVQAKIDAIGDFRFKIKGWSVTILSGVFLGSQAYDLPFWVPITIIPVIFLFYTLEAHQDIVQRALRRRVFELELTFKSKGGIGRSITKEIKEAKRKNWSKFILSINSGFYTVIYILLILYAMILAASRIKCWLYSITL